MVDELLNGGGGCDVPEDSLTLGMPINAPDHLNNRSPGLQIRNFIIAFFIHYSYNFVIFSSFRQVYIFKNAFFAIMFPF